MPVPTDCLAALIGLSQSGNACFPLPSGADAEITASGTGYYLDMLEGLAFKTATTPAADLYDRLNRARALGAQNLRATLRTAAFAQPRYTERGTLGGASTGQVGTGGPLTFYTANRPGGALRISALRLQTTATETAVVLTLDGVPLAVLAATNAPLQALAGLLIPLDGQPHVLAAELGPGNTPLQNKLWCAPCSGSSPWGQAVARNLFGGYGSAITPATPAQGFTLQVAEECADPVTDLVCYAASGTDLHSDELRQMLGQALMYTAGALLVTDLLTDARVDRYTMLEPKMLPALGARFEAQAKLAVDWLNSPDGLGRLAHPCYVCNAPAWQGGLQKNIGATVAAPYGFWGNATPGRY